MIANEQPYCARLQAAPDVPRNCRLGSSTPLLGQQKPPLFLSKFAALAKVKPLCYIVVGPYFAEPGPEPRNTSPQ